MKSKWLTLTPLLLTPFALLGAEAAEEEILGEAVEVQVYLELVLHTALF